MFKFIYYILYQKQKNDSKELEAQHITTNKAINSEEDIIKVENQLSDTNNIIKIINCTLLSKELTR